MFALAERLGMTVYEMERKLPVDEFFCWLEYYDKDRPADSSEILNAFGLK